MSLIVWLTYHIMASWWVQLKWIHNKINQDILAKIEIAQEQIYIN